MYDDDGVCVLQYALCVTVAMACVFCSNVHHHHRYWRQILWWHTLLYLFEHVKTDALQSLQSVKNTKNQNIKYLFRVLMQWNNDF